MTSRGLDLGVTMGLPYVYIVQRLTEGDRSTASLEREHGGPVYQCGCAGGRDREASDTTYISAQLCHTPVGARIRYLDGVGLIGHASVEFAMIDTQRLNSGRWGLEGPRD